MSVRERGGKRKRKKEMVTGPEWAGSKGGDEKKGENEPAEGRNGPLALEGIGNRKRKRKEMFSLHRKLDKSVENRGKAQKIPKKI